MASPPLELKIGVVIIAIVVIFVIIQVVIYTIKKKSEKNRMETCIVHGTKDAKKKC